MSMEIRPLLEALKSRCEPLMVDPASSTPKSRRRKREDARSLAAERPQLAKTLTAAAQCHDRDSKSVDFRREFLVLVTTTQPFERIQPNALVQQVVSPLPVNNLASDDAALSRLLIGYASSTSWATLLAPYTVHWEGTRKFLATFTKRHERVVWHRNNYLRLYNLAGAALFLDPFWDLPSMLDNPTWPTRTFMFRELVDLLDDIIVREGSDIAYTKAYHEDNLKILNTRGVIR